MNDFSDDGEPDPEEDTDVADVVISGPVRCFEVTRVNGTTTTVYAHGYSLSQDGATVVFQTHFIDGDGDLASFNRQALRFWTDLVEVGIPSMGVH